MIPRRTITLAIAVLCFVSALGIPECVRAGALTIVNGSFETGNDGDSSHTPIAGWIDGGASPGFWLQTNNSDGSAQDPTAAYSGSRYLTANRAAGGAASQPVSSTLSQAIVLSGTNLTAVQIGAKINLTFAYADQDDNDMAQVQLVFLDGATNEIGSISTGTLPNTGTSATSFQGWAVTNLTGYVDVATKLVRIDIISSRTGGTAQNLHFDLFTASIDPVPIIFTSQSPTPGTELTTNVFPLALGAVLIDGTSTVSSNSIKLLVDGVNQLLAVGDIVKDATTTTVSHAVSSLASGNHTVSLVYSGTAPAAGPYTNTWSFKVLGRPPICPRWAFEPWVWEDNTNTQTAISNLVAGYKQRSIPVGAVIIDSPWSTAYNSFTWDNARYPNPSAMISNFHAQGIRVVMWITGAQNSTGIDVPTNQSPYFNYAITNNYTVNGGATYSWWKGTGVHIDFTKTNACNWFGSLLTNMMNMGIDGWKADQAESSSYLPYPVSTSIGSLTKDQFKPYYYAAVRDKSFEHNPESLMLARPYSHQDGYAASVDKCTVGWCGDFAGDFTGLNAQIYDLYTSAAAGYGTLYVEIGGFQGAVPTKESLIRYAQFGALMPVMCNGGSNGGLAQHLPWYWDTATVDIYRYYAVLHSELAPYLFSCSVDSHLKYESIVKSSNYASRQHQLGDQFFVSLITGTWTNRNVTLPSQGAWIDYWNEHNIYAPGKQLNAVPAPLDKVPLYVRAGAIIPMNVSTNLTGHGDQTSAGKDAIMIYPFGTTSYTYHRPQGGGIDYEDVNIEMNEAGGLLSVTGAATNSYQFRVKSFSAPTSVTGADSWAYNSTNQQLVINKQGTSFAFNIQGLNGYSSKATQFELWQALHGISGSAFGADSDFDGQSDGLEYYLGSNPIDSLSPGQVLSWSSDLLSVSYPFNPVAADVTGVVEWTTDLVSGSWTGASVTYATNTLPNEIVATLGSSTTNQMFVRLKVLY